MKKEDVKKGYEQTPMYEDKYSESDWAWPPVDESEVAWNHGQRRSRERRDDNTR